MHKHETRGFRGRGGLLREKTFYTDQPRHLNHFDIWNEQHWPSCCHATFCSESEKNGIRVEATLYQLSAEIFGDQSKPWWCRHILITPVYQPTGQYALPYLEIQLFSAWESLFCLEQCFKRFFCVSKQSLWKRELYRDWKSDLLFTSFVRFQCAGDWHMMHRYCFSIRRGVVIPKAVF